MHLKDRSWNILKWNNCSNGNGKNKWKEALQIYFTFAQKNGLFWVVFFIDSKTDFEENFVSTEVSKVEKNYSSIEQQMLPHL